MVQNNNHVIAPPPGAFQEERRDAKVTYLTEFELNKNLSYPQHERLNALKVNQNRKKSTYIVDGGHTTDSSSGSEQQPPAKPMRTPLEEQHYQRLHQRLMNQQRNHQCHHRSEDELSAVSVGSLGLNTGSGSPRRRRKSSRTTSTKANHLGLITSTSTNHLSSRYPGSGGSTPLNGNGESPRTVLGGRDHSVDHFGVKKTQRGNEESSEQELDNIFDNIWILNFPRGSDEVDRTRFRFGRTKDKNYSGHWSNTTNETFHCWQDSAEKVIRSRSTVNADEVKIKGEHCRICFHNFE